MRRFANAAPDDAITRDAATRRDAAFAQIVQWGDPVLRSAARPVTNFDAALARQAAEMIDIMDAAGGVGLAAPQTGSLRRLIVLRPEPDADAEALVNSRIEHASDETADDLEGCLSLGRAEVHVTVPRARGVVVRARPLDGTPVRVEAHERHARVLQHEIDHLDGVLMLERTLPDHRRAALLALTTGQPWTPPAPDTLPGQQPHRTDP